MKTRVLHHLLFLIILAVPQLSNAMPYERQLYEIRIYHLANADQEKVVDKYLRDALIPAFHKNNISNVGVFKPIGNDTAADRRIYVLVPYRSFDQFDAIRIKIDKDKAYQSAAAGFIDAPYTNAPYIRIERIFTKAFENMATMQRPSLTGPFSDRIYEMRSYESATEKLHEKKVEMFNKGDEIGIFKRLGFNAVFYSQALSGTSLPNLVYMITFDNMDAHDKLWTAFRADAQWKKLSAMDEYQNVMQKANSWLLRPTDYSDY